jgi:hypothetical protein
MGVVEQNERRGYFHGILGLALARLKEKGVRAAKALKYSN